MSDKVLWWITSINLTLILLLKVVNYFLNKNKDE